MKKLFLLSVLATLNFNLEAVAQNFDDVTIKTHKITDNIYMLEGAGGNIGVSVGEDGVFIIDDQFAPLTPKINDAIKALSDGEIKFLVNTHWHGDHTGGNENMHDLGATIIAHHNVRKRLETTPKRDSTFAPKEALPVITFNDKLHVHINGEEVKVIHVANAHTDGDSQLYFTKSNVLHTGDTFFKERYPYIDLNSGGSIDGYIMAVEKGLELIDDATVIIPGHGSLSKKSDYATFLKMLKTMRDNVKMAMESGKTEDEVSNDESLTKAYDDLDYGTGFINSKRFRLTLYRSLSEEED